MMPSVENPSVYIINSRIPVIIDPSLVMSSAVYSENYRPEEPDEKENQQQD